MKGSYLGPKYSNEKVESDLKNLKANFKKLDDDQITKNVAELLADQKTVGWFQGRMEFQAEVVGQYLLIQDRNKCRKN